MYDFPTNAGLNIAFQVTRGLCYSIDGRENNRIRITCFSDLYRRSEGVGDRHHQFYILRGDLMHCRTAVVKHHRKRRLGCADKKTHLQNAGHDLSSHRRGWGKVARCEHHPAGMTSVNYNRSSSLERVYQLPCVVPG